MKIGSGLLVIDEVKDVKEKEPVGQWPLSGSIHKGFDTVSTDGDLMERYNQHVNLTNRS